MDDAVKAEIDDLRDRLAEMTDEERLEVFRAIADGYCRECGNAVPSGWSCTCMRDD